VPGEGQGQGCMSSMLARTLTALRGAGYRQLGITWIAEENGASLRQMEKMGARPLHHLHLFRYDVALRPRRCASSPPPPCPRRVSLYGRLCAGVSTEKR